MSDDFAFFFFFYPWRFLEMGFRGNRIDLDYLTVVNCDWWWVLCLLIDCFLYSLLNFDRTRQSPKFYRDGGWVEVFLGFSPFCVWWGCCGGR